MSHQHYAQAIWVVLIVLLSSCNTWRETYEKDEDLPYGLDLFALILETAYPEAEYVELSRGDLHDGQLSTAGAGDLYVAASGALSYGVAEADALSKFVDRGGTVFLASKVFSNNLAFHFAEDSCAFFESQSVYATADSIGKLVSAFGDTLTWPLLSYERDLAFMPVRVVERSLECFPEMRDLLLWENDNTGLRGLRHSSWMVSVRQGEGELLWLSVPLLLTNVYATDSAGRDAIDLVLQMLPSSPTRVLYDIDREHAESAVDYENQAPSEGASGHANSERLLAQVLNRPPLAAAWYLLLLGFLIFLIVGSKRRQRLVPLVHSRRNTTHEHLGNISRLYLAKPNNARMARKQLRMFEAYCSRRFGLQPLDREPDAQRLRELQGIKGAQIDTILRYHRSATRDQFISNEGFVQLVRILQDFYKQVGRSFD